ncbi:hypothetical protein IMZ48_40945 [Candidatus Bathyarchaeota archaeon]|nr:hypothetical protein [Candidatus Bathyarchaeota archaeon]
MSLHEAALKYQLEHIDEYQELEALLRVMRNRRSPSFHNSGGIICATPIAASQFQFRTKFRPEIVMVDEGGMISDPELVVRPLARRTLGHRWRHISTRTLCQHQPRCQELRAVAQSI